MHCKSLQEFTFPSKPTKNIHHLSVWDVLAWPNIVNQRNTSLQPVPSNTSLTCPSLDTTAALPFTSNNSCKEYLMRSSYRATALSLTGDTFHSLGAAPGNEVLLLLLLPLRNLVSLTAAETLVDFGFTRTPSSVTRSRLLERIAWQPGSVMRLQR
jgi:hypothetical protein